MLRASSHQCLCESTDTSIRALVIYDDDDDDLTYASSSNALERPSGASYAS